MKYLQSNRRIIGYIERIKFRNSEQSTLPRKEIGEKLEKVISSKLPLADFKFFESYAKKMYIENMINQPTISHVIRYIVRDWVLQTRKKGLIKYDPFQRPPGYIPPNGQT